MGRSTGVPGGPEIGSRRRFRAAGLLGIAGLLGGSTTCGWLNGDAEPIVLLGADAGGAPEGGTAACPAGSPFTLYYWADQASAVANGIDFLFKVANNSGRSVPLSALDVRYYFTNEITPTWATSVYYAGECCGASRSGFTTDVAVTVSALATPTATADHYLDVTFDADAGVLVNGDAVQIEVGFYAPEHAQNLNQANDYSFVATATGTQAEWDLCPPTCAQFESCVMTVYDDGALVWGAPP
jgi:Cellulose binding domain